MNDPYWEESFRNKAAVGAAEASPLIVIHNASNEFPQTFLSLVPMQIVKETYGIRGKASHQHQNLVA